MSAATVKKSARDLEPGDVLAFDDGRCVVTQLESSDFGVKVHFTRCGDAADRSCGTFHLYKKFTVELPAGLTPVQQAADKLLGYAHTLSSMLESGDAQTSDNDPMPRELRALLVELEPPNPPTIDEVVEVLNSIQINNGVSAVDMARVRKLLARVPK